MIKQERSVISPCCVPAYKLKREHAQAGTINPPSGKVLAYIEYDALLKREHAQAGNISFRFRAERSIVLKREHAQAVSPNP